ncbi:MAG TPA: sigma-70 family RNA polymerase sigma factor [Solirubrobacteraceae bacterium]
MAPVLSIPLLRTQSDRRLVALAADGHDRAFEAIVERYRRPLERYLRRLLSEALAEDVLQATFVRAWQALRAGTDVRELRPWLYRIAHNQALNTLRAAGSALPAVAAELPAISLEAEVERREELRAALDGIEALPDRQRAALVAIAVADRPHADVARELGMSDGALRQLLLRARTTLRAAATALTPYPVMSWLAGSQEATAARVAEVAVGAGGAGVALKAGVAALAAGAVVAGGPALRSDHQPAPAKAKSAAHEAHGQPGTQRAVAFTGPAPTADHQAGGQGGPVATHAGHASASASSSSGHSGRGHGSSTPHRSGSSSGSGSSGSGGSGSDGKEHSGSGGPGSGSGSGDSGGSEESSSSGSGSGSGESSGKGSSGRISSGDDEPGKESSGKGDATVAPTTAPAPIGGDDGTAVPPVTVAPPPSNSGDGSGDSGSHSGSGSGGSGSGGGDSGGD